MSTRQERVKSKDSTCDSEHGPDDEQADTRRHDAAGRQGRAGDAAAAPPGGREGQFNGKSLDFLLWLSIAFRFSLSGEYFQLNWLPDGREGLFLQLVAPLEVPHTWDGLILFSCAV